MTVVWTWGLTTHILSLSLPVTPSKPIVTHECELASRANPDSSFWEASLSQSSFVERFEDDSDWHPMSTSNLRLTRLPRSSSLYSHSSCLSWCSHIFLLFHPSVTTNPLLSLLHPTLICLTIISPCLFIFENVITVQESWCAQSSNFKVK